MPSVVTIKSGDYPLYRPLYLTYDPNSAKIDSVKDLINYLNSRSARDVIRANGVVPYTEALSLVMKKVRDNEASYPQSVDKR
jgi:phosphate transport system substrate-binding protein